MTPDSSRRWFGLAVLAFGVSVIIVDATIVNVIVPSIIRDLDLEIADAEWVITIYSVLFAALLLPLGRVGDLLGRRRIFRIGLIGFGAASILAAAAPSGGTLIGARVLQGLAAAMILPSTLASVNALFRGSERAIAFGVWGSVVGGMAALGPLLGGWLTTTFTWRWAFWINVPIVLIVLAGSVLVDETIDRAHPAGWDVGGIVTSAVGLGGIVFGLIEGNRYGWWTPIREFRVGSWSWPSTDLSPVPVAVAVGALALVGFVVIERRRGADRRTVLLDLRLLRLRSFRNGNITSAVLGLGEFGVIFVLPLFLQAVLGFSAFRVGLVLSSLALGAFVGGPFAAGLAHRYGPRRVVSAGMAIEAITVFAIAWVLDPAMSMTALVPLLFVYGIGVGLATAQLTNVILVEVPTTESGMASGARTAFRQIGSALGIAIIGTVLATSLGAHTADNLARIPGLPPSVADTVTDIIKATGGQALPEIAARPGSAPVVAAVEDAFGSAATTAGLAAAAFIVFGFLLSLTLPEVPETPEGGDRPLQDRPTASELPGAEAPLDHVGDL